MARRLILHLGGEPPPGCLAVEGLAGAFATARIEQGPDLALDLLRPADPGSPLYGLIVDGRRATSNAAAAYLHLKLDGTVLAGPEGGRTDVPAFSGDLLAVEQSLMDWVAARAPEDFARRLEALSQPPSQERHRRLALLRGHLTAMRRAAPGRDNAALLAVEARLTALIGAESGEWL